MEEETTLKDEIKRLNENFQKMVENKEQKPFKLPRVGKLSKSDVKKNYTLVITIGENREIKFIKKPINEGTFNHEESPRLATPEYLLTYEGKPAIILPEWSSKPFSATENFEQTAKDDMLAAGHRLLLNTIELGKVKDKKKFGSWWIFPVLIGLIVIGYLVFG